MVTRSDTIGGSHIHVRDMALALKDEGHEVFVLMGGDGPVAEHYRHAGLSPVSVPSLRRNISPWSDVRAYREIRRELERIGPDLVSAHSSKAGFLGRLAAKRAGFPVLFTAHGWSFTSGKKKISRFLFRQLEKLAAPLADTLITVSDYDRNIALRELSVSEDQIVTIHNGMQDIDPDDFADTGRLKPVNIVKIARFDRQKDHVELLEALRGIDNIHLHLVGDGPRMDEVKEKAKTMNRLDDITFWGRLDSVKEVLARGQLFALISNWEGFPRSTLEAMRAGLPVIVSDVGGAAEAVEHGVTGYVVQKGDTETLAKVIKELVDDPRKRTEMGKMARKRYEERYTFEQMYRKTVRIYRSVLYNHKEIKKETVTTE